MPECLRFADYDYDYDYDNDHVANCISWLTFFTFQ